ncbi:MAG TPA: hypothetical protein VFI42_07795 [Thermomicrobiaceae bacterium]|nr:hypothetical protein [Thermomicrobiaceae bacterium]
MAVVRVRVPDDLVRALESGELSREQLRALITLEAGAIGLSFDDAILGARQDTLPNDPIGADLRFLVSLLEGEPHVAE